MLEVKPTNRPEEVANRSSGTGISTDSISFNAGFLHAFLDQRFKGGHATRYTAGYSVIKKTRESEE